ncbi:MAG: hypothetical protein DRQ57_17830, partial [Gammaproteobacteria bacterium]
FYDSEHFFPPILSALVLGIFLINFPQAYRLAEDKFKLPFSNTWLTSDAALSLLGLIILITAGNIFSFYVLHIFYLISFSLFAYVFYSWLKGANYKHSYIFIGISVLFSIWVASLIWKYGLRSPLFFEELIFFDSTTTYKTFKDVLFHSSIINMIQAHNIPSTGLDGTPSFVFYFGSHWIFGNLAKLLDISPILFYNLAFPIIFTPFMFSSLLLLAINLKKWQENSNLGNWSLRADFKFWLIFFIANIGLIYYPYAHNNMILLWYLHIHGASYSLGLTLAFLLLGMLLALNHTITNKIDNSFILLVLPLMLVLIGFTKLSTALLILPLLFYLFIRLKLYKNLMYNLSAIIISGISIIVVIISFTIASQATTGYNAQSVSLFDPFNLLRTWIKPSLWLFFLFFCCFWSILFITLRLWYERKINHVSHLKTLFINRQLIDVEIVVILCVVGLLPGMLFHLPPYNHPNSMTVNVYFFDFQNWIALAFLLASMGKFRNLFKKKTYLMIPAMFGICFFILNYNYQIQAVYNRQLQLSQLIKNNPNYLSTTEGKIIDLLRQIGKNMPLSEKKKTLVFIPQSNKDFWNAKLEECYAVPFSVPAMTGMAMLDGLPPTRCQPKGAYGYESYENNGIRTKKQTNTQNKVLCSKALDKGFSQVLRIDSIYMKPRLISCQGRN